MGTSSNSRGLHETESTRLGGIDMRLSVLVILAGRIQAAVTGGLLDFLSLATGLCHLLAYGVPGGVRCRGRLRNASLEGELMEQAVYALPGHRELWVASGEQPL